MVRTIVRWGQPGDLPWDGPECEAYLEPLRERARARATRRLYAAFVAREFGHAVLGRWRRRRLTTPTLFLYGAADRGIRPDFLRGYERYADDLRLESLDGVGLWDADPQRMAQRIAAFLQPVSACRSCAGTPR